MTAISELCMDAVGWVDGLAQADADTAIQALDQVISVLRRDPRMSALTGEANLGEAITAISEALAAEASKGTRKSRRQADAETNVRD